MMAMPVLAQYVAQDPTRYIPNGRVLGLGKSFVGLADDAGAMFTNPAGLADSKGWQLSSMSGKFLDEYNYFSLSGLYQTQYGVIGFGYAGTSIAGAFATTIEAGSDPRDPIYVIDTTQPEMGNYNNAMIVSYGNQMKKIPYLDKVPYADRMSLGASMKLFRAALYGDGITNGDASGQEMDLGIKIYPPQRWMTLGVTAQNFLPFAMGGKLHYANGHEEMYPIVLKAGSAFNILGKDNSLRRMGDHELKLLLDADMHPTLKSYPMTMHIGLEWKPIDMLAVRAGIDQDAAGDGNGGLATVSDMAYGVGLYFGGFRFDYAYHTFGGAPSIDNNFFSLSYTFMPPEEIKDKIMIDQPKDKYITFEAKVKLTGNVVDPAAKQLLVNEVLAKQGLKGEFAVPIDLKFGKNRVDLRALDGSKKLMQLKKWRALRLIPFPDVKIGYWVDKQISLLAMGKVITGYPDGTFKPEGNITRAEMCSLLIKALDLLASYEAAAATKEAKATTLEAKSKVATSEMQTKVSTVEIKAAVTDEATGFKDVGPKHWAAKFVKKANKIGVVLGYPDGTFKPAGNITRAEGIAMISRFAKVSEEAYKNEFKDVASTSWAAKIIAGAYRAKLLEYLKGQPLDPNRKLARAETVEMLNRTTTVEALLSKDLLNWDSY
jgi:hypothetical protein